MKAFRCVVLLCFVMLAFGAHNAFAQSSVPKTSPFDPQENIYGNLYFSLVGPSSIPNYPRGDGNNEHWEVGLDFNMRRGPFEFQVDPRLIAGSTFDNPDELHLYMRASAQLRKGFYLDVVHTDDAALNNAPVRDTSARRGGSSVNNWWLGGRYVVTNDRLRVTVAIRRSFSGDEPVWFRGYTVPYTSQYLMMGVEYYIFPRLLGHIKGEGYFNDNLEKSRTVLDAGLERQFGKSLAFECRGVYYANGGLTVKDLDARGRPLQNSGGVFFTMKIRFGY